MGDANNPILVKMLERLLAGLLGGPNLNCRPHHSRQRIDVTQFVHLQDFAPEDVLRQLLSPKRKVRLTAKVPLPGHLAKRPPAGRFAKNTSVAPAAPAEKPVAEETRTPEERLAEQLWQSQHSLLSKLRVLVEDAKTYEQDTGAAVLNLGFPLLSLPPGSYASSTAARRILAPLAFVPVTLTVRTAGKLEVEIACRYEGSETVFANPALLAWIERQSGQTLDDIFSDPEGKDSWREVREIVLRVAQALKVPVPEVFQSTETDLDSLVLELKPAPRADDAGADAAIVPAAVLGLFPVDNQGLLRDMQAMVAGEDQKGPVESFIHSGLSLDQPAETTYEHDAPSGQRRHRVFAEERLVSACDPCQSRAVRLARTHRGLVIHGPPGTGKSQTITNIIGDHLARGERVLMVCDKRTALDVVANRLEHLGFGDLCALIHDPQHDQRELYRKVREQLEKLTDQKGDGHAARRLKKVDAELDNIHSELSELWSLLMEADVDGQPSFHGLAGQWLKLPDTGMSDIDGAATGMRLAEFEALEQPLSDLFTRAERIEFSENLWAVAAGIPLDAFLARPMQRVRDALAQCIEATRACDAASHPTIPPFVDAEPIEAQGHAREEFAALLDHVLKQADLDVRCRWSDQGIAALGRARKQYADALPLVKHFIAGPLDSELSLITGAQMPSMPVLAQQLGTLQQYLDVADRWYGFLFFRRRSQAAQVQAAYGLPAGRDAANRLQSFLLGVRARLVLTALHATWSGQPVPEGSVSPDEVLDKMLRQYPLLFDLLARVFEEPQLAPLAPLVERALVDVSEAGQLMEGLRRSPARAAALERMRQDLEAANLFEPSWISGVLAQMAPGKSATKVFLRLQEQLHTLQDVLRTRDAEQRLPRPVQSLVKAILRAGLPSDASLAAVRKAALNAEIGHRLEQQPSLRYLDAHRLQASFARYRQLEEEKRELVRRSIWNLWTTRQHERLLVSTGSRLSGEGADLKRRFTMRGERAIRLRQVVALGQEIEGGDPLFDLRPVWLASPETVAQVFPRREVFDVVIFDEASQCRLEEALPVLTRAKRVVIAGDPKQLPPTRFFETALASSENEEIESGDQLFETVQSEIEDLLTGALSLEIEQSYLDVHYRSRNADLIAFSNDQFYSSRLQPVPGHPSRRAKFAPITLYHADGVYQERSNAVEAEQVCRITRDLLRRAEPPSIGIACFNLQQRDVIVEKLDELASEDPEFAARLAESRSRRGAGSFEGLFIKNLENVQGDERDHIIISTTYGPDAQGRFYRRFGPLTRAGGGRRLNVLVTRARQEVHLVTSIPASEYRNLPPLPSGETPTGSWLLFAYLQFAERLAAVYAAADREQPDQTEQKLAVTIHESRTPSLFAAALAHRLVEQHGTGSEVHWGNDGFCVDVALQHPQDHQEVTLGVLCDGTRFAQAEDPVEWDAFRTAMLETQGWQLARIWTPDFFRDPTGAAEGLLRRAAAIRDERSQEESVE